MLVERPQHGPVPVDSDAGHRRILDPQPPRHPVLDAEGPGDSGLDRADVGHHDHRPSRPQVGGCGQLLACGADPHAESPTASHPHPARSRDLRATEPTPRSARTPGRSPRVARSPARSSGRRSRSPVRTPPPCPEPGAADWTRPGPAPAVSPRNRPPGLGLAPSTAGRTVPAAGPPRSAPFPRDG